MSKRWLILVAILVLLGILLFGSGESERGSPPSRLPAQTDAPDDPSPPGVPPPEPDADAAVSAGAEPTLEAPTGAGETPPADRLCIAGRVLNADGVRPAQAYIQAVRLTEWDAETIYELEYPTDDEGRFRIDHLVPGRYRLLVDPGSEKNGGPPDTDPVVFAGDENVVIVLAPRTVVTVKVVAEPGGPKRTPNTLTTYRLLDDAGERISSCAFQGLCEDGMTHHLAPGRTYRIEAHCGGYRQAGSGEFFLPPGTRESEWLVRLEPLPEAERAKITFRIHDDLGDPVKRLLIQRQVNPGVIMGDTYEPRNGSVEFALSSGTWTFYFDRARDAEAFEDPYLRTAMRVELRSGEQAIRDVTLRRGGWVRFHLVPGRLGDIHLVQEGREPRAVRTTPAPDGAGLLLSPLRPLHPGKYGAFVLVDDVRSQETEFEIHLGEVTDVRYERR